MAKPGSDGRPTLFVRAALACAALLPWFAVFSGTYGLYFYVVLAVSFLALPPAVLLLLVMPLGTIYAALRRPPGGWAGQLTRGGCLASMGFTVVYGGLMVTVTMPWVFWEDAEGTWEPYVF